MNGIRIAKPSSDLQGSNPSGMQLDTSLETLPIETLLPWTIFIFSGYTVGSIPPLEFRATHGLGYTPIFRGWEESVVGGETRYISIPTGADSNNFITAITANDKYIYVRAEYTAFSYPGSSYRKKGYFYVYEKKFKGLPS